MSSLDPALVFPSLGPKFTEPRPVQLELLNKLYGGMRKLNLLEAPTGIGKSAIAVALGRMVAAPLTVVTTSTISLEEQYARDFEGVCTLIGKNNFECTYYPGLTPADAPCAAEGTRQCKSLYYEQEKQFGRSRLVVTNYALYLNELLYGRRWYERRPVLLVCDEGHNLFDQLISVESVELDLALAKRLGLKGITKVTGLEEAKEWARRNRAGIEYRWFHLARIGSRRARDWMRLKRQVERLESAGGPLIVTDSGDYFRAAPAWPSWSAAALRDSADSILLMSATLYGGALLAEVLGYGAEEYQYLSVPSPFPAWRWPVFYRPVTTLNHRSPPEDWTLMGERCHELMHARKDKGIIHVASHEQVGRMLRALYRCPECRKRVVAPVFGEQRAKTIARFRQTEGAWLVHPSVGEGESFDDEACRTQIIAKVRYPDLSDPLVQERMKTELGRKLYFYSTAAYTVQALGRGMRHEEDYCENFIFDGGFGLLYQRYAEAFPYWFKKLLR